MVLKPDVQLPSCTMPDPGKIGLSADECFVLDVFRHVGASRFASYPVDDFIYGVVRQVGESQPSVKHAAMAFTVLGHPYAERHFGEGREKLNRFVLRQTSKSITHLLQQPTPKDPFGKRAHREVVMTMCGLLTLVAVIDNDVATLKMHLNHGQRAMREWQEANFDGSSIAPTLSAILVDLNWRLQIASNPACFLQDDNPWLLGAPMLGNFNVSTAESTVDRHWRFWSTLVLNDDYPSGFASYPDCPTHILISFRISFLFKVRIYTRQLKACIDQVGHSAAQSVQDLLMAFRLWEQTACAVVAAALMDDEGAVFKLSHTRFDGLWIYFRRINEFARKIMQSLIWQNISSTTNFPIDLAVGTPLFFCGFYCRDWSIRREALRLLKAFEERFRGSGAIGCLPMKVSALERIIDIESHGLQPGDVVPELARICHVEFSGCPGSSDIRFLYRPAGMDGLVEIL